MFCLIATTLSNSPISKQSSKAALHAACCSSSAGEDKHMSNYGEDNSLQQRTQLAYQLYFVNASAMCPAPWFLCHRWWPVRRPPFSLGYASEGHRVHRLHSSLPAIWEGLESSPNSLTFSSESHGLASNRPLQSVHAHSQPWPSCKTWPDLHKAWRGRLPMTSLSRPAAKGGHKTTEGT